MLHTFDKMLGHYFIPPDLFRQGEDEYDWLHWANHMIATHQVTAKQLHRLPPEDSLAAWRGEAPLEWLLTFHERP